MDCKIITIEGEGKVFLVGSADRCVNVLKFNRNWEDRQEWEGCIVKIQSLRSHKKQMPS
jgi:hypothetical protein